MRTMFAWIAVPLVSLAAFGSAGCQSPAGRERVDMQPPVAAVKPTKLEKHGHVRVDVFVSHLPMRHSRLADVAIDLIGLFVSLVLFYFGALATLDAQRIGSLIFKELIVPEWWLLIVMPFSAALLTVEFARRLFRRRAPEQTAEIKAGF